MIADPPRVPSAPKAVAKRIAITPPKIRRLKLKLVGAAPYLQCRFSQRAMLQMMEKQQRGDADTKAKHDTKPPRDYDADYQDSLHRLPDGRYGIPAAAFRSAAISACRLVNFKMTLAKLAIFVEADGYDIVDATPLVQILGEPEMHQSVGRNATGVCDIRTRAIWKEWSAVVTVRFDEDQFKIADIVNLFARIGEQVGIGEGRPDSRNSSGLGYGTFVLDETADTSVVS